VFITTPLIENKIIICNFFDEVLIEIINNCHYKNVHGKNSTLKLYFLYSLSYFKDNFVYFIMKDNIDG